MAYCIIRNKAFEERAKRYNLSQDALEALEYSFYNTYGYSQDKEMPISFVDDYFLPVPISDKDIEVIKRDIIPSNVDLSNLSYKEAIELQNDINQYIGYEAVKPQHLNNGSYQIRLTLNDRQKYHQNASEYNSDEGANEELETQILEDFNKHIQKPIDKRLNKHLTEILEKFGVTTADIKKIKDQIPDGVLGVYDILNKVLYASEEGNKTTFVEEASHSLIEMLGAVYKPIGKKEDVTAFADYTRLYDLIEGTTLYSKVYEQYKDEYVKNGKPDIDKIKKEAIGQALATAIINNWERKEEEKDKSFWDKLKEFFDKILSIIKQAFSSNSKEENLDPLEKLLDDIAEDVISKKLKRFNKKDQSKYRLVTVDSSLKEQEKLDQGEALQFMQDASALGMIVTDSFSYRGQGTVYRKKGEILHDIDLVINPSVHGLSFSSGSLISAINRYKKIGEGDAIQNFLAKQPILKQLIDKYNIQLFTGYETSTGVITSGVFSKKYPELAKKFVQLKGSYENRIKQLKATPEQLANFYILDFFFEGNSENDYVYDAKNKLNFSKAQNSFKEKLKYGRVKDVVDYQRFKWYKEYRENKLSENVMFQVNPITYTEEQQRAIDTVVNSYNDKTTPAVIIGKAGTGKTTVVAGIIEKIKEKMPPYTTPAVLVGALSHEAKGVLYSKLKWLEKKGIATVTAGSVAGILSKKLNPRTGKFERQFDFRTRTYVPTLIESMKSSRGKVRPNIVFIDEASMLGEEDYKILCDEAKKFRVKIVFLGDTGQLEPPRSEEDLNKYNVKQDTLSKALIDPNATTVKLTERIRQGEGHPLLDYADRYWEYSHHPEEQKYPNDIAEKTKINEKGALLLQQNSSAQEIVSQALPLFLQATEELNPNLCKIICYRTNDRDNYESTVSSYNAEIKRQLNAARGIVENTEYFVPGDLVIATENFAPGNIVLIENGQQFMVESVKSVVAYDPYFNTKIPKELKQQFKEVNVLTVTLINSEGNRYTVDALATSKDRVNHKYNFKLLLDYINQSSNDASYRDIASYKSDVANLDLAFAIGVHKSQGSTYEVAIIDASDINSVTKVSPVTKARGIYTALTRASNVVVINSRSAQETKVYTNPKEINDWIKARKEGKNIPIPDFQYETVEVTPTTEEEVSKEVHNRKPRVTSREIDLSELFGTPKEKKVEPKGDNGWGGMKKLLEQSQEKSNDESNDENNDESNSENSSENSNYIQQRLLDSGDFNVENIDLGDIDENNSTLKDAFTNLSSYKERKEEVQRRLRDARNKTNITFYNDSHTYTVNGVQADYSVTEFVSSVFNIENHSIERKKDADIQKPLSIQEKEEKERSKQVKYKVATFPGDILDKQLRKEFASIGTDQENLSEQAKVLRKNIEQEIGSKDLIYITDEELLRVATYVTVNGTKYLIAGTLDMLVVDSKGNKYIVDFKTKRENNAEEWRNDVKYKYKAQQELYGKMLSLEQDNVNENAYLAQFNVRYAWNNNYIESGNQQDFVQKGISLKAVMSQYRNIDDNDSIFAGPRFYALHNINSNDFNLNRNDLNSIEFSPVSNSTIIREIKKQTQEEQVKALNTNLKNIRPAGKGRMNFSFDGEQRDGVKSKSTLAAIIRGERTATTRYKDIDYWKRVAKEGNIIEFYDSTSGHESRPHVYVRVTKSLHRLDENTDSEEWSKKEGWGVEHYNKSVLPKVKAGTAYQFEFEYLGIVPNNTENNVPEQIDSINGVTFTHSPSQNYAKRTSENAAAADITIALAADFETAGEKCTKREALKVGNYVKSGFENSDETIINDVYNQIVNQGLLKDKRGNLKNGIVLNVAGNGIYTLVKYNYTQEQINERVQTIIKGLIDKGVAITKIISGGQTGVDEAGIVAGLNLGIPCEVHTTKGWRFRDINNKDIDNETAFKERFNTTSQNVTEEIVVQDTKQTEKKKKTSIIDSQEDGKKITRGKAEHNSDTLYIFNDNTRRSSGQVAISRDSWYYQRYGNGSDDLYYPANNTSAIIRGLDNARPLSTQRWYEKGAHAVDNRWNNEQFEEFKKVIDQEVEDIKEAIDTGNYARLEFMGGDEGLFNQSISMISEERVPELYHYLKNKQQEIKDYFNNKTFNFINEEQDTEDTQGDNPAYEGSFLKISNLNIAEVKEQKIVNDAVLVGVNTEEFLEGFYPKSDFYNKQAAELLRTHKAGSLVQFDLSRPSLPLFKTIVAFAKNPFVYRTGSTQLMDEQEVDEKTLEYVKKNEIFNYDEEKHSFTIPYFTTYFTVQELKSKRSKEELYNSTLLTQAELRNISKSIIYKLSDWVTRLNNVVGVYEVLFKDSTSELAKTDFTKLSRTEIIEKIGLGRILSTIRNTFFSNAGIRGNMKISTLRKIHELNSHWDALVELGYDVLLTTEKVAMQNDGRHTITSQNVFEGVAEDSEPELIAEIFGDPLEFWQVDFRSVDVMSSLSQLLRATFNTLNVTDLDGNIQYSEFGIEEKQDSREIVAKLLSSLQGLNTLDKMIAKLEELKGQGQAWVVPVLDKLNEGDTTFNSQFFSFIRKYFQPYVIIRKLKKGKGTIFVPVNTTQQNEVVILEIKENEQGQINGLQKGSFKLRNKGGEINEANYNSLNTLTKDLTQVLRSSREKELSDEQLNTLEEILDLLDIPLPENEIFVKTFNNRWYVLNEVLPVISLLSKKINEELNNKTLISDLYEYRKLVAQVYKNTPDATISVSYEAGKLYYSYVTPSYLNRLVEKLSGKYMSSEEYNEWIQREYAVDARFYDSTTNSWRNAVLENLSTRPAVRKNFEHIVHLHYNGIPYKNMSPGQYIAQMVKNYFYDTKGGKYAYYRVGLLSNKPSAEYIKYLRFGKDYKEEIKKRMFDVFLFELTRIKAVKERSSLGEEYKINNFDGKRGESFCFLDWIQDILDGKENINIYKGVENKLEDFRSALQNILDSNVQGADVSTISVLFEDLLEANMNYRFEQAKQVYEDEGYITKEKKNGKEVISFLDSPKMTMSMLEEFYWADAFMQIQLLQLFVGDIAQYKDSDDLQKRLAQLHSPGIQGNKDATDFYGNPVSDGFIRSIYLKDAYRVSTSYKNVAKAFDNITKRVKDKDVKDAIGFILNNILEQYKDINIADAQSITCPTSYRKKQFIFGKWSTADEDAYNILMNPESSDAELLKVLKVLWQPLKPFVYTQTVINGNNKILPKMRIGRQEKNSEYVLILADALLRRAGQEDVLTAIYDFMEESHRLNPTKGIDSIQFESAVKAGGQGIQDLEEYAYENGQRNAQEVIKKLKNVYSGDDNIYKEHLVHVTPVEDYIIQQDNPPHFADHQQIAGSQNRALTFADQRDDEYIDDLDMTVGEARTIYNNAIKDNIEMSLAALKREFQLDSLDERAQNIALSKLLKYQMLKDGRYGTDMLWAVDVNSYGYFNMPLSDPTVAPRIIQLIYSTIKNRINKQKFKGGPIVQMSCWGRSEELSVRFKNKKGEILYTEKEFQALQNNTADIKIQTEGYKAITGYNSYDEYIKDQHSLAYLECYAPIPYEGFLDDFGITLDSGEVVVDMEKVKREAPDYLKLIGYRIPTEAKYSMLPLKVVGFMPKLMGEGIMLPADLTLLTGSDFDVDKLYAMAMTLIKDKEGNFIEPKKGTIQYNNNQILKIEYAVLTSSNNLRDILSPGNFDGIKEAAYSINLYKNSNYSWDDIKKNKIKENKALIKQNQNLVYNDIQVKYFKQNMVAGHLVGISAVANVRHAFMTQAGDIAYIDLPDNMFTLNGVTIGGKTFIGNIYDQTGVKKISSNFAQLIGATVDAVKDPVLNLININTLTINAAINLMTLGFSFNTIGLLLSQHIVDEVLKRATDTAMQYGDSPTSYHFNSAVQSLLADKKYSELYSSLLEFSTEDNILLENLKNRTDERDFVILKILDKLAQIDDPMREITNVTRFNSYVASFGPNVGNAWNKMDQVEAFLNDDMIPKDLKNWWLNHPILNTFYEASVECHNLLVKKNFKQASDQIRNAIKILKNKTGYLSEKDINAFIDFFMSAYVSQDNNGNYLFPTNSKALERGMSEKEFMLTEFPHIFMNWKKSNSIDNIFIKNIRLQKAEKEKNSEEYDSLQLNLRRFNTTVKEDIMKAWQTLLSDQDIITRNMAKRVFEYWFFRGGIGFSPKTATYAAPNLLKKQLNSYVAILSNQNSLDSILASNQDLLDRVINQFILHNLSLVKHKYNKDFSSYGNISDLINEDNLFEGEIVTFKYKPYVLTKDGFIKVDALGGNNEGFELDLSVDYPDSIFTQSNNTNDAIEEDNDEEENVNSSTIKYNQHKEDVGVILDKLFDENDRANLLDTSKSSIERAKIIKKSIENNGYNSSFDVIVVGKVLNEFAEQLVGKDSEEIKRILNNTEKELEDLNLCKRK